MLQGFRSRAVGSTTNTVRARRPPACAEQARTAKDVDIDWRADEEQLAEALIDAHDAGDFFAFTIERTSTPEDRLGSSHRLRVAASLAGRPFKTSRLDVDFLGDEPASTQTLTTKDLLAFGRIVPVEVKAVPLELQVAEKLHAYTRTHEGGHPSTRRRM